MHGDIQTSKAVTAKQTRLGHILKNTEENEMC
jgi:hypothetical protein